VDLILTGLWLQWIQLGLLEGLPQTSINLPRLTPSMVKPGIPNIEFSWDIGIASIKKVRRKNYFNEYPCPPFMM
jgi:hypothetical protein